MLMSSNISLLLKTPSMGFHIPEETMEPNLKKDILNFLRIHPGTNAVEAAQSFRMKWAGYKKIYSISSVYIPA